MGKNEIIDLKSSKKYVLMENFSAFWSDNIEKTRNVSDEIKPVLSNLDITFKENSLNMVVGTISSGKSSLLYSIL